MTTNRIRRRASGYVLNELLLAVAAVSMLAAASGGAYMYMKRSALADDMALKMVTLVNDTRRAYQPVALVRYDLGQWPAEDGARAEAPLEDGRDQPL